MLESLGITSDQVYGDVYNSWLRDTHEKNTAESKQLFREMVENGFLERQIILRRQRLGVNVMNSLATALHRSPLIKLDLHGNALRDTGVEVLAHLMRDLPHLTYLDLGANDIGAQGIQSLSFVVAQHRKLSTLILGSSRDDPYANRMTPVSATILLEGCLRNRSIRNLDLSGNAFGMELTNLPGAEEDGEIALRRPTSGNRREGDRSPDGVQSRDGPNLSSVRGGPRQPMDLLEQLIRSSSTLTTLRLKEIDLSPRGALLLVNALRDNATLLLLDVSNNHLPPEVGDALGQLLLDRVQLQNNCQLRTLLLNGNNLFLPTPPQSLPPIEPQRKKSVHKDASRLTSKAPSEKQEKSSVHSSAHPSSPAEEFGDNVLITGDEEGVVTNEEIDAENHQEQEGDDDEMNQNMSGFGARRESSIRQEENNPFMDEGPSTNPGSPEGRTYSLTPILFATLANDRLLTTLEVDRCGIDDGALYTLCRALFSNPALQTLSLDDNYISADGAVMLGRSLCRHPCLKRLRLSSNCIEDEGGCALASMLSGNKSLERLDLRKTWLGDRGLIALGNALQSNHSVRAIYLGDNHFTEHGGASFAAFLEKNDTVIKCQLGATSVPHQTILRMQHCLKRNAKRMANAEPDALKKELVRLHFQKYKVEESRIELENLREKNNEVKRHGENTELQAKQDQSDFMKRIRELEEQIENYTKQEEKYRHQRVKLEADLEKEKQLFVEDMELAKERLKIEIQVREKVEEEFKAVEAELADWKNNGEQREEAKREKLNNIKEDMNQWAAQRKEYKQRMELLNLELMELETNAKRGGTGKKGKGKKGKKGTKEK